MSKEKISIYHKSNCSTSLEALRILKEAGPEITIIEYLVHPLTADELKSLLKKLGMKASELVRKKEAVYKEKFEGKKMTEAQWIKALAKYPILMERPIVLKGGKAIIPRPMEKLKEFL
jgi:arsenate reductase